MAGYVARILASSLWISGCFAESLPLFRAMPRSPTGAGTGAATAATRADCGAQGPARPGAARLSEQAMQAAARVSSGRRSERCRPCRQSRHARTARSRRNGEISSPQVAVIDNVLTDEALEKLRQYCWRSTVWQRLSERLSRRHAGARLCLSAGGADRRRTAQHLSRDHRPSSSAALVGIQIRQPALAASKSMPTLRRSTSTSGSRRTRPISIRRWRAHGLG